MGSEGVLVRLRFTSYMTVMLSHDYLYFRGIQITELAPVGLNLLSPRVVGTDHEKFS